MDKQELTEILENLDRMSEADRNVLIAIMHRAEAFRADWAQKIRYFLLEQGWKIE